MNNIKYLLAFLFLLNASTCFGVWPEGLSLVALEKDSWHLYVVQPGEKEPQKVTTSTEPRTPTYSKQSGRIAYIGSDGSLYEKSLADARELRLLSPDKERGYTQPAYDHTGRIFIVALKDGTSIDTDILALSNREEKPEKLVFQRSAQFEPYLQGDELYYSNVSCTMGCGRIIQEIWKKNVVSGEAEQVTMTNSIARQPVLSPDGMWLYFSSNRSRNFHIWRQSLENRGVLEKITEGRVTDLSPAFDATGNLYFIRQTSSGCHLMRIDVHGNLEEMIISPDVLDIRDLEIDQ